MEPLPEHPAIIPDCEPRLVYGRWQTCSRVVCPHCHREKWYPHSFLRRYLKRLEFTGACTQCTNGKILDRRKPHKNPRKCVAERWLDRHGYVVLREVAVRPEDRDLFRAMMFLQGGSRSGSVLEHRFVVAKHLGRPLADHEDVHHKNGKRDDNRLANLELWSHSQPRGQRVADKVAWAREILALYSHLF